MSLLFVYGTLKRGFPNAHVMRGRQVAGRFVTALPWRLLLVGEHHTPWLVESTDDEGLVVEGELYDVAEDDWLALDALEDIGKPWGYRRAAIDVQAVDPCGTNAATQRVQVYMQDLRHLNGRAVQQGPLSVYTLDHAAHYRHDGG
jgi:gamma-glutamylaminecyclotransferase